MRPRFVSRSVDPVANACKPGREERIQNVNFHVYKFSDRERPPETHKNIYFSCFSEFGCETVATGYCIPRLVKKFPGYYFTAVGWHGREFLYRHLVDEYWEIGEEHQHLREHCLAFHNDSKNLKLIEDKIREEKGIVVTSQYMGRLVLGTQCEDCGIIWTPPIRSISCNFCDSTNIRQPFFRDIDLHRQNLVFLHKPSPEKMSMVREKYLGMNPVAIFARGRKKYGRNLKPDFYVSLISKLREGGYDPIWLGEKASTQPCPVDDVIDFSRMPEARDLETTLAIVSQCSFTVQFWTASTRLASMVGTPFMLFESPDQLWGNIGQEGMRLELLTIGKRKISANDFRNIYDDPEGGIAVFEECLHEIEEGNFSDHIGLVKNRPDAYRDREEFQRKLGRK